MSKFLHSKMMPFRVGLLSLVLVLSACGGGVPSGVVPTSSPGSLVLLAGAAGGPGSVDAVGEDARFHYPNAVALDSAGNVYVADSGNHVIRKISAAGVVTTLAGVAGVAGSTDAVGAVARLNNPKGVAVDSAGNVYVADSGNHTVRKISPAGLVSTLAGAAGIPGGTDASGASARFNGPNGVAVDGAGNVYVADTYNHTIRKIAPGGLVTTLAGTGSVGSIDATGASASFNAPSGVAVNGSGDVYVADTENNLIRHINPVGVVSTYAGSRGVLGTNTLFSPTGVAVDHSGQVYVADMGHGKIAKVNSAGLVEPLAGGVGGSADGMGTAAGFFLPAGVAVDATGHVYVADTFNHAIRKITAAGAVTTMAGRASITGANDGLGSAARFFWPHGVAVDSANNVYVVDNSNHTIRKITDRGMVSTLVGTPGMSGSQDGAGGSAQFGGATGVAVDLAGNLYVADSGNQTVRKVTPAGLVSTLAGAPGLAGSANGHGASARFDRPSGIALDGMGNVFVAETNNHTIRKINAAGDVSTLAGSAGIPGHRDGAGAAARFNRPDGLAVDSAGNVYVADSGNHTIRRITQAGVVTTFAGTPEVSGNRDASGTAASFNAPVGLAFDAMGHLYVADSGNYTIRKITSLGMVTTIAGTAGVQGLTLGTLPAILGALRAVAVSSQGVIVSTENAVVLVPFH